jgi:DnaJ-domain-containing protein 1
MDFNTDHFSLFELPASFRLDAALLDRRYLEMQSRVHPDRFRERWRRRTAPLAAVGDAGQ